MKKKLIIAVVAAVIGGGGAYKTVLAKPKEPAPKPKVAGAVYILPKEFLVNLSDDRFAKLSVGFVMAHDDHSTQPADAGGHGAPSPPEGYGTMPQEAIVRDLITNELTGASAAELVETHGREEIKSHILKSIKKHTDVHPEEVLFMDLTVQ